MGTTSGARRQSRQDSVAHAEGVVPTNQWAILETKLFARPARAHLVARPRIAELLDQGLSACLTLVSAPAGFGKTTAITDWLGNRSQAHAWLSLDAADNDPGRFLTYVIAALQRAIPGLADDLLVLLRSPEAPPVEAIVTALLNDLAQAPDPLVLVLDDYHVITSAAVNVAMSFLLENLPPHLHLVLASRSDPAFPIARLRSRGQVVEVRADDLRFTPAEAAAFLGQTMGLTLAPEQVAALDERAEGWIAGLQMAALSLRGREDVDGFIQAFAGTHRFIMDFMLEEVLAREPQAVQDFLLQTAVLTRLCGPLCDAVTGATDSQTMLEGLESRNLFVVPLDDERRWYRYHHLFADLLQARLYQSGLEPVVRLLSRAADWCEHNGETSESIAYAIAGRDYERASRLIARYWPYASATGEIETIWSWLEAMPEDVIRRSAPLCVARCWVLWLKGQTLTIEDRLLDAERAMDELAVSQGASADDEVYATLPCQLAALRSFVAGFHFDHTSAIAHAECAIRLKPVSLPPQSAGLLHTVLAVALASAHAGAGNFDRAVSAYAKVIHHSHIGGSAAGLGVTGPMIKLLQVLGRLREAERRCREALRFVEERGMARLPAAGILHVALAEVLVEQNRLAEAESHLSRGLGLGKGSGRLDAVRNAPAPLSRLRQARRDTAGALAAIEDAEMALGEASAPEARALLLALKARIQLRKGSLAEAARCIEEAECLVGRDRGHASAAVAVAAARVMLAVSEPEEAISQLTQSLTQAEQSGRLGSALELRILRSLAHARNGDIRQAEKDLEKALAQAEPEGYVRIFVDEGEPMEALLRRLATRHGLRCKTRGYSPGYVLRLLAAFGESPGGVQAGPDRNRATAGASEMERVAGRIGSEHVAPLVEALSERELQVLRLMAAGRTNKQIAAELVVAVGTVKTHIHHICGKLGGQNRAHAIARARELDLL